MKKVVAAAASSAAGFAVVFGAHASSGGPHGLVLGSQHPSAQPAAGQGASPAGGPSRAEAGATGGQGAPSNGAGPEPVGPTPLGQAVSAVGATEQYGYGVLSVKVTVQGGRITGVDLASLRTAESYSQMIAQQVIPILRQEVLRAQGVQVNGISGATYTTEAYLLSVQSALAKLHA